MSKKKVTKKVSIFSVSECCAFRVGELPCVVHFELSEHKVTFTTVGDELPKIGVCVKFLREHFTHLDDVKEIVVEALNW